MPYGAQDGVWGGLRGDFGAEATEKAISGSQCHIGVASEFRVGGGRTTGVSGNNQPARRALGELPAAGRVVADAPALCAAAVTV